MSPDLDERIAATLRSRAGSAIDTEGLVRRARLRGDRLRRRRRALAALGSAAATALVAVALITIPGQPEPDPLPAATVPSLPAAPEQPGAADRPDLVGADLGTLHFDGSGLLPGAARATWSVRDGVESVSTGATDLAIFGFALARSAAALPDDRRYHGPSGPTEPSAEVTVGGRPGSAYSVGVNRVVRWQPADGLWAWLSLHRGTTKAAVEAANRIRFDRAQRLALPFRLTEMPAGIQVRSHGVEFDGNGFAEGTVVFGRGETLSQVRVLMPNEYTKPDELNPEHDVTAGPHRVDRVPDDVLRMRVGPLLVETLTGGMGRGLPEADLLPVLSGYRQAGNLGDPATW